MNYYSLRKKQLKALKKEKGVQQLLNDIYNIMGHPMVIFDLYYNGSPPVLVDR